MSDDCTFCKIARKEKPAKFVYEDAEVFAFQDSHPHAPTHILICPRKHFAALHDADPSDQGVLGKMLLVAAQIAREQKVTDGYRVVFNNGRGAGQTIFHLHLHLMGGRPFRWPPG